MSPKEVEAVWCIPLTQANFRAPYGRLGGTKTFTKDFFQIPGAAYDTTVRLLMDGDDTTPKPIDYHWPSGAVTAPTGIRKAPNENTRLQMSWPKDQAPAPWRVTPTPSATTIETFPGDPGIFKKGLAVSDAEAAANKVWDDADAAGIHAWALAIKLKGETGKLHARMYLVDPPPGYEFADIGLLPPALQKVIRAGTNSALVHVFEWPVRAKRLVKQIMDALTTGPNVLLTGPPGTGKTVALEDLRSLVEGQLDLWMFDPAKNHDAWAPGFSSASNSKVVSLVFHPSYSYENFVLGVFPSATVPNAIEVVPGPLLELAHYAEPVDHQGFLIIDEFNRGRAAAIFGDALALMDEDKRSNQANGTKGSQITRRYPSQTVKVSPDYLTGPGDSGEVPGQISLPYSLNIVAAMNSSDRSVAPLDGAMRRRFSIIHVEPDYDVLAEHYGIDPAGTIPSAPSSPDDVKLMAYHLLKSLNRRIRAVSGPDFELGHALVWKVSGGSLKAALDSLAHAIDQRIVATMVMTYRDETDILGAILRAPETSQSAHDPSVLASWVDAPADLDQFAPRCLHISALLDVPTSDRWQLLLPLVQ